MADFINVSMQQVNGSDSDFQGSQQFAVAPGTATLNQQFHLVAPVPPGYPNTSPNTPTGTTQDGSGTQYTTSLALGSTITHSVVGSVATISAPTGQTLPTPLTITITLTYGGGERFPKAE